MSLIHSLIKIELVVKSSAKNPYIYISYIQIEIYARKKKGTDMRG